MQDVTQIGSSGNSLREAFGLALVDFADKGQRFIVLDGDVAGGTGVHHYRAKYPDRYINCGIAEQNMMGVAAGISLETSLPVFVTGFAAFLMRGWEIARLSIAYNNANVKVVASHPGLDVGPDGASAQSFEDLACWRAIPRMTVLSPCDPREVYLATEALLEFEGPGYMRTGRSTIEGNVYAPGYNGFEIGLGDVIHKGRGSKTVLIGCGVGTFRAVVAASKLQVEHRLPVTVVNMSTIKPIDGALLRKLARNHNIFFTIEDHNVYGGLGSAVAESLSLFSPKFVKRMGVRDCFGRSGEPHELNVKYGIDVDTIVAYVLDEVRRK